MNTKSVVLLIIVMTFSYFITDCSKDESTQPQEEKIISGDYFPFSKNYMWTYSSNALSKGGVENKEFDLRIDTFSFSRGNFTALLGRLKGDENWGAVLAIKDSGNIVYSIGDYPPETPYPLFKHQYYEKEVLKDTLNIAGNIYPTLKYNLTFDGDTLHLWFANGVGLVKEFSRQGISLFTDDNSRDDVEIKTELISYTK